MSLRLLRYPIFVSVLLILSAQLYAKEFDQSYLKWKEQQEKVDAKLKSEDPNYYLSRADGGSAVNKQEASKSSASISSNAASNSAKIKINSANITELQQLNGVGEKKAQAIIEYRQQHGKFKQVDELQNIKGIGPKLIEKNRARLAL